MKEPVRRGEDAAAHFFLRPFAFAGRCHAGLVRVYKTSPETRFCVTAAESPPSGQTAIVIPARYGSTRFPGKPLARQTGKFLIQHVVEQAAKARRAQRVVVATDDPRIYDAVRGFGGHAVMTSDSHQSGTDRIAEVMKRP